MQTEAKLQPVSDFGDEEDYDLIGYVALRADDADGAGLAWQELYRRHFPYLFDVLKRVNQTFLDELCLEDLATETINRAFDKADSFQTLPEADRQRQRRHIRAWLGRIAQNLINSELQKYKGLKIIYPDMLNEDGENGWEDVEYEVSVQNDNNNEWASRDPLWEVRKSWVVEAFYSLTDREQHILSVTLEHERLDKVHQKLPHAVSSWLADFYKTTPENIRKIRERAKHKVKEYVEEKTEKYNKENQKKE